MCICFFIFIFFVKHTFSLYIMSIQRSVDEEIAYLQKELDSRLANFQLSFCICQEAENEYFKVAKKPFPESCKEQHERECNQAHDKWERSHQELTDRYTELNDYSKAIVEIIKLMPELSDLWDDLALVEHETVWMMRRTLICI